MARPVVWAPLRCPQCQCEFQVKPCDVRAGRRFCSVTCRTLACPPPRRPGNQHAFRGDAAGRQAMHYRARQLTKGTDVCQRCPRAAQVTHHRDGNPRNNALSNLERLCRRCHVNHHRADLQQARERKSA